MARPGKAGSKGSRSRRPAVEALEGRSLMASGVAFESAFGLGVSGTSPLIKANSVAVDSAGDTFVTGSFRGTVSFDPYSTNSTLNSGNCQNAFVAKYAPGGSLAWLKVFSGRAVDRAGVGTTYATSQGSSVALDASGNVLVGGSFGGVVDVAGPTGTVTLSSPSGTEAFAAKLDASGNLAWAVNSGGAGTGDLDEAFAVAPDGSGGAILAGSYTNAATFGPFNLQAGGSSEAFAARIDSGGHFFWATSTRGSGTSVAHAGGLAVDGSGSVVLVGSFSGTVAFNPANSSATMTSAGSVDAAVWKLGSGGSLTWARRFGSTDYDSADAVAVDGSGNIDVTGAFSGSVAFGPAGRPDTLTAGPIFDAYVLKLDPSGNETWARGLVGPGGWSKGQGIGVDGLGNVHLAGTFNGAVDFDPGVGTVSLTSVGSTDVFAAGLDGSGNFAYALQAGKQNANLALGLAVDPAGQVAVAGTYAGPIAFGSTTVPAIGQAGAFVARLGPPPPAPSAPVLEAASDTGASATDGITSATSPVLDVLTAGATNTVRLLRNGVVVASRVGPGAIRDPGPLADNAYVYTAMQVNPFGLAGPASPGTSVTILTRAPAAPTSAPAILGLDDSGKGGDGITNVRQPRLTGSAGAGSTIQVVDASGTVYGSGPRAPDGSYSIRLASSLLDGTYLLGVRAVDLAGNVGPSGPTLRLTILATPPAAPAAPTLLAADRTGPVGSALTANRQPRLTGSAPAGAGVQVFDGSGTLQAIGTADSSGNYVAPMLRSLLDGTYLLSAVVTDVAGNPGPLGPAFKLTIDTTPPAAPGPLALASADDTGIPGDGITSVRTPALSGLAEPLATVQVVDASLKVYASAVAGLDGSYTARIGTALVDGPYALRARAIDPAGNIGAVGQAFPLVILGTPPAAPGAPTLVAADDSGTPGDRITSVVQPRLTGSATPGITVQLFGASSIPLGTAVTSGSGVYVVAPSVSLADGSYTLRVVAVDAAGNASPASGTTTLTILATPPPKPAPPALLAADDTGAGGDGITAVRAPRIAGTAAPNDRVDWIGPTGSVIASTTSSAAGAYQFPRGSALASGTYSVRVRAVDVAGNVGPTSDPFGLVIRVAAADLTGAGPTGFALYNPSASVYSIGSAGGSVSLVKAFGIPGDVPISGDFFGTGHSDLAVYRPSSSTFVVFDTVTQDFARFPLGQPGDVPAPADYDGDGRTDFAVYRPSTATFYVSNSATGTTLAKVFGLVGDIPVPADYFGTGHAAMAVYRPGTSTFVAYDLISQDFARIAVGSPGDLPVPADYEGIGRADDATYTPGTSTFHVRLASGVVVDRPFGIPGDIPVPGDYFGDGQADLAVYRPSTSMFVTGELTGDKFQRVSYGQVGTYRPALMPVNLWFRFGTGSATPVASSATATPMMAALIPIAPVDPKARAAGPAS